MFCLRSWLPLLFIPTNASPAFVLIFFVSTYLINRPCVYCSFLLLILFLSSCHWSDHCFFDFQSNWFEPRHLSSPILDAIGQTTAADKVMGNGTSSFILEAANSTITALAHAALDKVGQQFVPPEWTGIGLGWARTLLGKREWRLPCVDVYLRI